jgi:hypothetical protein
VDLARVQIDVKRAQRRKLTPPDAGLDRYQHEDAIPLRDLGQHRLELLRRDRLLRLLDELRQHRVRARVDTTTKALDSGAFVHFP